MPEFLRSQYSTRQSKGWPGFSLYRHAARQRRAFTLVELLIVLAILGIMAMVVVPQIGNSAELQVALAAKDTLRLVRYARNMALQTQQPITLTFSPGQILLASPFDKAAEAPAEEPSPTETAPPARPAAKKRNTGGVTVQAGDIDTISLTKHYDQVAFAFLGYDDNVTQGRSAADGAPADFHRRLPGQTDEPLSSATPRSADETFSVTIRANGTTRPFSIRVFPKDDETATGDTVSFDFLCSGTIGE